MQRVPHPRWTVSDVIDFEHLLAVDARPVEPGFAASADDRRATFLAWVRSLRATSATVLPGEHHRRALRLVVALLTVAGCVIGAGLAGSILARHDTEPVNALLFFGFTVGVQIVVLVLVALAGLARAARLRIALAGDVVRLLAAFVGWVASRLDGERRTALHARLVRVDVVSDRLMPLVGCEMLIATQWFAIGFNVGLLAAMLLVYLPFEELRFGWQSTYSFTAGGVERWVHALAAPWLWISPSLAPDATAIEATRFTRGQPAQTLPAGAALAWWPFLISAIVVYGLLVRYLLAGAIAFVLRRRLDRLAFNHPAANALWRRLNGPLVAADPAGPPLPDPAASPVGRAGRGADLLIVDRELAGEVDTTRSLVERHLGGAATHLVEADIDDDRFDSPYGAATTLVVATRAGRDPIVAIAGFLRALAERAPDAELTVLLVGDDPQDARLAIWRRFVTLQRLAVGVERAE